LSPRHKYTALTPELYEYVVGRGVRRDDVLERVARDTDAMGDIAVMQTAPDQGALITLLVGAIGARLAVEVGTFTGYSAICIARGLAGGGRLVCCEVDPGYAQTALENLRSAELGDRVEVRVGPALDTLRALPLDEPIDFAFVDADKPGYADYYEELLARLRPGGLIMLDNVLLRGRVLDPDDDAARAMATLNDSLAGDERVDVAVLAVSDGVTLLRKR
jgi:caffeoyl-CoA O-methyltransferase